MLSSLCALCGGGGTGRRKGLKIPCPSRDVPVRFRPSAPYPYLLSSGPHMSVGLCPALWVKFLKNGPATILHSFNSYI